MERCGSKFTKMEADRGSMKDALFKLIETSMDRHVGADSAHVFGGSAPSARRRKAVARGDGH
jgi:hypothetical protein